MSIKKITGYTIFLNEIIGRGSYGSVYVAERNNTKDKCAVKMLHKRNIDSDQYLKAALFTQIKILKSVKSQNIVGFYDVMESTTNYYIVQQLCDTDLQKFVSAAGGKLSQQLSIKILTEICNGFLALVKEGILHRDLKPANILMKKGKAKIGDFGFAKKNCNKKLYNQSSVGTPLYMPLQILKGEPYTSKCDIWALGYIFYYMLHGVTPWTATTEFQLVQNIQNMPLKINPNLSAITINFIEKCLQTRQVNRISWDQLFLHPIFKGYFQKFIKQNQKFENKLKRIMSDIRFMVNVQNINIPILFEALGLSENQELSFKKFQQFLQLVNPYISNEEQIYVFQKLDRNNKGLVSLAQLQIQMEKNNIKLEVKLKSVSPCNSRQQSITLIGQHQMDHGQQNIYTPLSLQSQQKIRKCFIKLYKILKNKNITLYQAFLAFDIEKSGQLSISQFSKILKKLDQTLTQQQIFSIFHYIDKDKSNSIQFDEFNSYYCKVNGIPYLMDLPPDYHAQKLKQNNPYLKNNRQQHALKSSNQHNKNH